MLMLVLNINKPKPLSLFPYSDKKGIWVIKLPYVLIWFFQV